MRSYGEIEGNAIGNSCRIAGNQETSLSAPVQKNGPGSRAGSFRKQITKEPNEIMSNRFYEKTATQPFPKTKTVAIIGYGSQGMRTRSLAG